MSSPLAAERRTARRPTPMTPSPAKPTSSRTGKPRNSGTTPGAADTDRRAVGSGHHLRLRRPDRDVISVNTGSNGTWTYTYDGRGNRLTEKDPLGNLIVRTYGERNELLTETVHLALNTAGTGPLTPADAKTTRFVYDAENHLRFVVSSEGVVAEYRYNTQGQQKAAIAYTSDQDRFTGGAASLADLLSWRDAAARGRRLHPSAHRIHLRLPRKPDLNDKLRKEPLLRRLRAGRRTRPTPNRGTPAARSPRRSMSTISTAGCSIASPRKPPLLARRTPSRKPSSTMAWVD